MGRWSRGSKLRADENGARGVKDNQESIAPSQLVTKCEPEAMVAQLRGSGEVGGVTLCGAELLPSAW